MMVKTTTEYIVDIDELCALLKECKDNPKWEIVKLEINGVKTLRQDGESFYIPQFSIVIKKENKQNE